MRGLAVPTLVLLALLLGEQPIGRPERVITLDINDLNNRPAFSLDAVAWQATHIVVATEGQKIDGELEILESWKGDLKKGDRIRIPELAAFAPKLERVIFKKSSFTVRPFGSELKAPPPDPPAPTHVTCARMVLFLA